jgi:hypothetical protein
VPKNGQHFYLWQLSHLTQAMIMQQSPTAPHSRLHLDSPMLAPRKLLKLFRGYSPALVRSASFSSNSRWLAVTSDRGTTHIYSISNDANTIGAMPEGTSTPVDDPTVARATNVQEVAISHHQQQIHAVPTVMAVHRIRQSDVLADVRDWLLFFLSLICSFSMGAWFTGCRVSKRQHWFSVWSGSCLVLSCSRNFSSLQCIWY